ncbi:MAG: stage V sporulation protein AD [Clostridia bacterium]|nr:stage V sporulation protein AD [Clostridia bacterium]
MSTLTFEDRYPCILETASSVGKKEGEGNLGQYFDNIYQDAYLGEKSWEKAESRLVKNTLQTLLDKTKLKPSDIDVVFGGDLLNQCIGSNYGLLDFNIPFFGLYGACSTFVEGLILASITVNGGHAKKAVAITSSHFCSSERQFRFPLEYGGQRTPTAQWTVTGSGAALVSTGGDIRITHATVGKIVDYGIKDVNNMGAAMAPAAIDTIVRHFKDRNLSSDYFDLVVTGDLGMVGRQIVEEQLFGYGIDVKDRYLDCGEQIFDGKRQDTHAGGSGCGCCASVFSGWLYKLLQNKKYKRILLTATGALMNPTTCFQGENIPGIAHAVAIERTDA